MRLVRKFLCFFRLCKTSDIDYQVSSSFSDHEWGALLVNESEWVMVRVGLTFGVGRG